MARFPFFEKLNLRKSQKINEDYWFKIAKRLYQEFSRVPEPIEIRANAIINAFNLPSASYSAIEINKQNNRANPEKDRIIAKYLTNNPGIKIKKGIISLDPRDIYPNGLPRELKEVLDPATRQIFEIEYEHIKSIKEKFGDTKNEYETDRPIHYFRLPGGIDLILRGYTHTKEWQEIHGKFLKEINRRARIICIEGFSDIPYGESIPYYFGQLSEKEKGFYDVLIKDAIKAGFNGFFTEIDARNTSKIKMDHIDAQFFPPLPTEFFEKYYDYLITQQPSLIKYIKSPQELEKILKSLSTSYEGILARKKIIQIFQNGKCYTSPSYITKKGEVSFEPTFLELGQLLFSDALAAIKLHLIAKLMTNGYIKKGPIIDYEGAGHLSSKTFFLKYPQYAMIIVLRTINELMAGKVENLPQIYEVFKNPDWTEVVKEIVKLIFYQQTLTGLYKIEYVYHVDPQLIPSDEEIKKIQEKFKKFKGDNFP